MKTALVTGITGQDGIYLTELLLKKIIKFLEFLEVSKKKIFFSRKKMLFYIIVQ